MRNMILSLFLSASWTSALPLVTRAQVSVTRTTPAPHAIEVSRLLREEHHTGGAVDVLTQLVGNASPGERNAIGDTLVAVLLSDEPTAVKSAAASTLISASLGHGTNGQGVPYLGGPERMYRIAIHDDYEAPGMVAALGRLPDTTEALHYLRLIATSEVSVAQTAVESLGLAMGARGIAVARELFEQNLVRQPWASRVLERVAYEHGWKRPDQ
jgi:hypothetical protein